MQVTDKASADRAQQVATFTDMSMQYRDGQLNAIGKLNIADVGFNLARKLIPSLVARIDQLEEQLAAAAEHANARSVALDLERWQRWTLQAVASGARVVAHENMAGDEVLYRIGDTFYMGGDPDFDAKNDAVRALIALNVIAALPQHDVYGMRMREWSYRLTDFGAAVAVHLVDVLVDEASETSAEEQTQEEDANAD